MTAVNLREEMEEELTWRSDELRMFKNNLASITNKKEIYRKSLVVMLYAHFEGFTKMCFLIYVKYINSLNLKRITVKDKPELVASSMNDIFKIKKERIIYLNEKFLMISQYTQSIEELI